MIAKRKAAAHIPSALSARRFAPHVYLPRIVIPNIKNKRNSHITGQQTDLSRSVLLFKCELRLLTYRYFAVAAILGAVSFGYFASAENDQGLCPLDTHHPLKSVDVNSALKFVQLFSIIRFFNSLYAVHGLHFIFPKPSAHYPVDFSIKCLYN